mmetsp:Transcript_9429/g.26729  ORF Transcript_9429/g.26729 Transcript_9429/m.26729 type:complete len:355 (+) Transcript_9429:270-1334(+)
MGLVEVADNLLDAAAHRVHLAGEVGSALIGRLARLIGACVEVARALKVVQFTFKLVEGLVEVDLEVANRVEVCAELGVCALEHLGLFREFRDPLLVVKEKRVPALDLLSRLLEVVDMALQHLVPSGDDLLDGQRVEVKFGGHIVRFGSSLRQSGGSRRIVVGLRISGHPSERGIGRRGAEEAARRGAGRCRWGRGLATGRTEEATAAGCRRAGGGRSSCRGRGAGTAEGERTRTRSRSGARAPEEARAARGSRRRFSTRSSSSSRVLCGSRRAEQAGRGRLGRAGVSAGRRGLAAAAKEARSGTTCSPTGGRGAGGGVAVAAAAEQAAARAATAGGAGRRRGEEATSSTSSRVS